MDSEKFTVRILLYDISNGMAKQFSPMLLGKVIEGVWHTGLIVHGKEYFYGGGICVGEPKMTPYGTPAQELPFGDTEIPLEIFESYLMEINERYNMNSYHILNNNCNHFTNEILSFLTGESLPEWVLNQHKELSNTGLGKMILPMLENMNTQNNQFFPQMFEGKK